MAEYIDREKLLGEIDKLKLSPWFNRGKKTEIHNQHGLYLEHNLYLERKEGVEIVTDLCIKQQVTADVVERSMIDKAIERMDKYAKYFDDMGRMGQSGAVRYTIMILKDELDI